LITTLSPRPIDPQNQKLIAPVEPLEFVVGKGFLLRQLRSIGNTGGFSQGKLSIASCSAEAITSASLLDNTGKRVPPWCFVEDEDSLFTRHSLRGVKSYNQTEVSSWPTWKNYKL
jgi:hypothetical protein